jgi:hypothetical protein
MAGHCAHALPPCNPDLPCFARTVGQATWSTGPATGAGLDAGAGRCLPHARRRREPRAPGPDTRRIDLLHRTVA